MNADEFGVVVDPDGPSSTANSVEARVEALEHQVNQIRADMAHALKNAGKYGAGYNRALSRRNKQDQLDYQERERLRDALKAVEFWNERSGLLPQSMIRVIKRALWGDPFDVDGGQDEPSKPKASND